MYNFYISFLTKRILLIITFISILYTNNSYANFHIDKLINKIDQRDFIAAENILQKISNGKSLEPYNGLYTLEDILQKSSKMFHFVPELQELEYILNEKNDFEEAEFSKISNTVLQGLNKSLNGLEKDELRKNHGQAIYRALYDLSILKSKTKFSYNKDNKTINGDEQQSEADQKKESASANDNDKPQNPWDRDIDQYKPRNKPFDSSSCDGKASLALLIETDAKLNSGLLAHDIFDTITSERWSKSAVGRVYPYNDSPSVYSYKVHTYDQNIIPLPIPLGYRPKVPAKIANDVQIIEAISGEYILITMTPIEVIELELIKQTFFENSSLNFKIKQKYLTPTGINKEKWPNDILDIIATTKAKTLDPYKRVKTLTSYIKNNFNYYSQSNLTPEEQVRINNQFERFKSEGDPDPVAFSKTKTCQCDGAAWILASLVRDFLNIPARVVTGRPAVLRGKLAVVRANDPKHAWAEVWIENYGWMEFDATPHEKNKKEDQKSDNSKDRPINPDKDSNEKDNEKEKTKKDHNTIQQIDSDNKKEQDSHKQDEEKIDKNYNDDSSISDQIEEDYYKKRKNSFLQIYFNNRIAYAARNIGNPEQKILELRSVIKELIEFSKNHPIFIKYTSQKIEAIDHEINYLVEEKVSSLDRDHFDELINDKFTANDVRGTYYLIRILNKELEFLSHYRSLSNSEEKFQQFIQSILESLEKYNHPNANSYERVYRFWNNLPGPITKKIIQDQYGNDILTVGSIANLKLADDIKDSSNKKLANLYFLSRINNFTDILLQKRYRPAYELLYFGKETKIKQNREMLNTLHEISGLTNAILPMKPMPEILDDFINGKIYTYGYRQPIKKISHRIKKAEILTLALVDESKSMQGKRTRFAQGLVSVFIDKARKEGNKNLKHDVIVIPFSNSLGKTDTITNDESATTYLNNFLNSKAIIGGGTDIQRVLVNAYEQIANSFKNLEERKKVADLRKANIWLITDGESPIDPHALKMARDKIPADVNINLNIAFIGQKNEQLISFLKQQNSAIDTKQESMQLKFISDNEIITLLDPSTIAENSDLPAFATDIGVKDIHGDLISKIRALRQHSMSIQYPVTSFDAKLAIKGMGWNKSSNRYHDSELESVLNFINNNKSFLQKTAQLNTILDSLMNDISSIKNKLPILIYNLLKGILND